mmetsp:Transcript_2289/g.4928  ORF Transcript_2289/g.4928 Transcript_2289/m.4928 type:complete len:272 (-) Transcript_2289:854-1669(-)
MAPQTPEDRKWHRTADQSRSRRAGPGRKRTGARRPGGRRRGGLAVVASAPAVRRGSCRVRPCRRPGRGDGRGRRRRVWDFAAGPLPGSAARRRRRRTRSAAASSRPPRRRIARRRPAAWPPPRLRPGAAPSPSRPFAARTNAASSQCSLSKRPPPRRPCFRTRYACCDGYDAPKPIANPTASPPGAQCAWVDTPIRHAGRQSLWSRCRAPAGSRTFHGASRTGEPPCPRARRPCRSPHERARESPPIGPPPPPSPSRCHYCHYCRSSHRIP